VDELAYLDAGQLAELIRGRQVSALEALEAQLARIARHNPALNAIVTLDIDGARALARGAGATAIYAEEAAAHGGPGPLHGVALTLKDCHATAGMRTTAGAAALAGYVQEEDGAMARRLKRAGAIILGKTNVSELLGDVQCDNPVFGRANNPWDVTRTPGGSSGGAAAAVAAGLTPLDIGSDIGGSIRIPAHCCGVYGFKPTEHAVSNAGHIPDLPGQPRAARVMNACGPLARSLDDLQGAYGLIAGPAPRELDTDVVPRWTSDVPRFNGREVRVAWASSFPGAPVASDIRAAIERLAGAMTAAGWHVEEALPALDFAEQLRVRAVLRRAVRMFTDDDPQPPTLAEYFSALDQRDRFIVAWETFFEQHGALLCPTLMTSAFEHCPYGADITVDGVPQPYSQLPDYCRPFNLTGHPVVTLPIGHDTRGLPIGAQFVGPRWSDAGLLSIARALAELTPGFQRPPGY
jgi:amidase